MVINNHLAIWITEKIHRQDNEWLLKGLAFDSNYGFGREDVTSFEGNTAIHYIRGKSSVHAQVFATHSTRIPGALWTIQVSEASFEFPSPPFLVTDIVTIDCVFYDVVKMEFTKHASEVFDHYGSGTTYPIGTDAWFGLLEQKAGETFFLTAFSSQKDCMLKSEEILFLEWDIPVGYIT